MALSELLPPMTLPRGAKPRRPPRPGWGTLSKFQLKMPSGAVAAKPSGAWMKALVSGPPASSRQTETAGFSLRRLATTQPAEPPPTTM